MFENKKIFILGMARSGYEAAKLLAHHNNQILITDQKEQDPKQVEELEMLGLRVVVAQDPEELLDESFDFLIKNPGIRADHKTVLKAKELKIPVINEIEMAYHFLPEEKTIIGITGSNGKTTTTMLTYELLRAMNLPVILCGNMGIPLSSMVEQIKPHSILVMEISSHQLRDFKDFKTDISVLTNLSEVHLDFFGNYENYVKNKKIIFAHHTDSSLAIINSGEEMVLNLCQEIISKKITFSSKKEANLMIQDAAIYYFDEKIIELKDIRIKGEHNFENCMCAIAIAKQFGVSNEIIYKVLNNFSGVEHRLEFVRKINGREFYNDSKATNVQSTQIALSAFQQPTILILGGLDRGHSLEGLTNFLENTKHIICYGETKERIFAFIQSCKKDCTIVETLEDAVKAAYNLSNEGDVILLSPACASWDQFASFEERGECFKQYVEQLNKEDL